MGGASAVPPASRATAVLLWIVAAGWGLPAPWLMWWVLARGRLPVLPIIGQPNGGPFYFNFGRRAFVALLAISFVLAFAQGWAAGLLWAGKRSGALLQFGLLPVEQPFGTASASRFHRCSPSSAWSSPHKPGGVLLRQFPYGKPRLPGADVPIQNIRWLVAHTA
jgi:hypothetical protein